MHEKGLTIGRLAEQAGVNVETVRYYQRVGLITEPPRPMQGFRHYPSETINRIRFIKRAQQLGFKLDEIRELLDLGSGHCEDVRSRAEKKREQIVRQIRDLESLKATLDTLIDACREGKGNACCPVVEALTKGDTMS